MSILHEVRRTGFATYLYLPATTPGGSEFMACIGWARRTVANPFMWEVRVPSSGDWTAVDAFASRVAAERRLSELTGRTL